jgi:FkbM family methyltransferase
MFNDDTNPKTNGETAFFNKIKDGIGIVFDVGCRSESDFTDFEGEVHYFDPVHDYVDILSKQPNKNTVSHFNNFGLGNKHADLYYYPHFGSFYDRIKSCGKSDDNNKILLNIKPAADYILEKNIKSVDFLKIDTEGYELDVIMGFKEHINNVKIIQFEYGGTFIDNNITLFTIVNFLESKGFCKFSYITPNGLKLLTNTDDHYRYCNIACIHKNSDINLMKLF